MITMAYQHTQLYPPHRPRSISDTPVHLTVVTPPAYHRMNTFAGQPQPSPPYSATDPMHTAIQETHDSSYIDKSVQHLHEQSQQPVFRYSSTVPLRPTPLHTNPHHPIISHATTTTVPPPSSYQLPPIMASTNAMTTTTATATATADVPVTMTTTAGSMTEPHATVAAATTMTSQPLKASSSAKRGTDGFLLFRADQRKMYPDEKASEASLDQRWRDLPEMHKKEYHQRAIIINSRMEEEEELRHKRSFREMDAADKPNASRRPRLEHLVSPEAIRTAEIEEQEEAMGKSERRPFSGFPSFMYMKYMRERETGNQTNPNEEQERMDYGAEENQVEQIEHVEGEEDDASYNSGDDNDDMSVDNDGYSPSQSTSSPGHLPMPSDELPTTSIALSSKSRINMASHLGAAEFDALASLDDISSRTEGGEASSKSNNGSSSSSSTTITTNKERLKRPPNGYLLFNRDMRRKLLEISPKMTVAEISKEIGERWKNLPPEQKESYMLQAARIKQDHLRNHPDFIYTRRSKAQLEEARRLSKSRRTSKASLQASGSSSSDPADPTSRTVRRRKSGAPDAPRDPRGRKKKRHKHPKAPKHPMSGFLFFLAAVRPEVARQFPGSTVGPISKIIASQWREMTDEARIPWLQKAEEDKARYAREMQEYNASLEAAAAAAQENKEENEEDDMDDRTVQTVVQMVNSTTTKVPLNDDMEPAVALNGGAAAANTNNTTTINNNSTSYYSPEPVDPFLSSL